MKGLKKSTPDAVVHALFPEPEQLLLYFEQESKPLANAASAENDRLRKFIQDNIAEGQYGKVILTKKTGSEQVYPNAEGKSYLTTTLISNVSRVAADKSILVLGFNGDVDDLLEAILSRMQHGKDHVLSYLHSIQIGTGQTVENTSLYSASASTKIDITVLP